MNNESNQKQPNNEEGHQLDDKRDKAGLSNVNRKHGGETILQISKDELEVVSNPKCKHPNRELDPHETSFDALMCLDCPMVWLYTYGTIRNKLEA